MRIFALELNNVCFSLFMFYQSLNFKKLKDLNMIGSSDKVYKQEVNIKE